MSQMLHRDRGFTAIELLIAVGLLSMLLLTISAVFISFIVGTSKTHAYKILKAEGTKANTQIDYLLRNARRITSPCVGSSANTINIEGLDGGITTLQNIDNKVASVAAYPPTFASTTDFFLTGNSVELTADPTITCRENSSGQRLVEVSFTLQRAGVDAEVGSDTVTQTFNTWVEIRNQ